MTEPPKTGRTKPRRRSFPVDKREDKEKSKSIHLDLTQLFLIMVSTLAIGLYMPPVGTTLIISSDRPRFDPENLREFFRSYATPS